MSPPKMNVLEIFYYWKILVILNQSYETLKDTFLIIEKIKMADSLG